MCNFFSVSDFSLLDTSIYKVTGRGVLYTVDFIFFMQNFV